MNDNMIDNELDDYCSDMNEYIDNHNNLYKQLKNNKNKQNKNILFTSFENNFVEIQVGVRRDREHKYKTNYEKCSKEYAEMKQIFAPDEYNIILDNAHTYTTEQLIKKGTDCQEETIHHLDNMIRDIKDSKEIAIETMAELGRQQEQLILIGNNAGDIKSELNMATKRLRVIARNLSKDWIIRILCFLVLGAIITVVILFGVLKKKI